MDDSMDGGGVWLLTGDENAFKEALKRSELAVAPKTLTMSIQTMELGTPLGLFSPPDFPIRFWIADGV